MSTPLSAASAADTPPGIPGVLSLYQRTPTTLSYHDSSPSSPHTLVFVPGLTDTLASVPYLALLVPMLHAHGFSLVQPLLTSNMSGWGLATLEGDAQELARCLAHLRRSPAKAHGKVVIMGHSTGCQDVVTFLLSQARTEDDSTKVDAAILQAPVSDREDYEWRRSQLADDEQRKEWDQRMQHARTLVQQRKGGEVLARLFSSSSWSSSQNDDVLPPTDPFATTSAAAVAIDNDDDDDDDKDGQTTTTGGNSKAALTSAFTAYRFTSLYDRGGDDDLFSSSLSDDEIVSTQPRRRTMGAALRNLVVAASHRRGSQGGNDEASTLRMLAIMSDRDEYRWNSLLAPADAATQPFQARILEGGNHKVDDPDAQRRLVAMVQDVVLGLL
ncbi:uncharacterized protein PFL1_03217 [Pseudozyma flocculosa PF-1]|uniref:DUF1749-domain-containing protein n=1 Tax=Pseudozyma flocculosa PF-1 TaxID=1277687 RepID=A0A061H984_9BASI|nr:uncharacterized protein PFL1_03217 [Pseudozyma flocculosa PF-1]EPQ29462.1 hypothetical protein PFL1_03217 [Pseudozyma flocculosa PF-1]